MKKVHSKDAELESSSNPDVSKILCPICSRPFESTYRMGSHMKLEHGTERPFECPQCDQTFALYPGLQSHINRIHLGLGRYRCQVSAAISQSLFINVESC